MSYTFNGEPMFNPDEWPKAGDRMMFLGKNGYSSQLEEAMKKFIIGNVYTVADIDVGSSYHTIDFEGVPGSWNGVMFKWLRDEQQKPPGLLDPAAP